MKTKMEYYLVVGKEALHFTQEVSYLDDGDYFCRLKTGNELIEGEKIFKLSSKDMSNLFDKIAEMEAFNLDATKLVYFDLAGGAGLFTLYRGGVIVYNREADFKLCVVVGVKDVLCCQYVMLDWVDQCVYDVVPCSEAGVRFTHKPTSRNPYSPKCNEVYNVIKKFPGITTPNIIKYLNWPANRVTPRLTELAKGGRIRAFDKVVDKESGRKVSAWGISDN